MATVENRDDTDVGEARHLPDARRALPRWPLTILLAAFPLWWVMGLGTLIWPLLSVVMVHYLVRRGDIRVPRGFGIWLLFLLWVVLSVVGLDSATRLIGFTYRLAMYGACTIIFIYVYNLSAKKLTDYILGVITLFFAAVVAGGYLGLALPTLTIKTPLSYVLPGFLLSNDLVREIAIVGTTQFNPDAWAYRDPRPSAPFLYTNNWGNAYSILLPLVASYLIRCRGTRRFWPVLLLIIASFPPAFLTLNRGMFLGLGIAALVMAWRYLRIGDPRGLFAVILGSVVAVGAFIVLPISERLDTRLESSGTNESRLTVYTETIMRTAQSPFLGFGAPRPAEAVGVPHAGTQGQVWMVLFSHGYVALFLFLLWFVFLVTRTRTRGDLPGITCHAVLVVTLVEVFYYGILVHGLALVMIVAGLALHPSERGSTNDPSRRGTAERGVRP